MSIPKSYLQILASLNRTSVHCTYLHRKIKESRITLVEWGWCSCVL